MKTKIPSLQQILLAAGLTLGGYAQAYDLPAPDEAPGMAPPSFEQGGPGGGHEGHGGPDGRPGPGDRGPGMGPHGPEGMLPMMGGLPPFLHGLELTEAQQDKVFTILYAEIPYLREQGKAARKAHEALRALTQSAQYDDARAAALAQAGAQAMANITLQHVRTEQKLLALLTPEQRKQLAEHQPHHLLHP
jgi:Spy/CpxP family protein refolding chaperone